MRLLVSLMAALLVTGCSAAVEGNAITQTGSSDNDGVDVAVLDTGDYAVAAGPPFATAGEVSPTSGNIVEAHRMASFVVGPWQVNNAFRSRGDVLLTSSTLPLPTIDIVKSAGAIPNELADVMGAHGFVTAFSTLRFSDATPTGSLLNMVVRFADPAGAAAAAREMAEKNPLPPGASPRTPVDVGHPDALATIYENPGTGEIVESFTPYKSYVFINRAWVKRVPGEMSHSPKALIQGVIGDQRKRIDTFKPTPIEKLGDLPMDPTGQMLAATLWNLDNQAPANMGAWPSEAWVHFETDPVKSAVLFRDGGVDYVSQRRATVYRARDDEAARKVAAGLGEQASAEPGVSPARPVKGLPQARCYTRARGESSTSAISWQRVRWQHKCVAFTDRFAFTVFSSDLTDAQQQISAQYRILAGR
ncbi:DUF7373 family lipoprotein [Mycolicibacterium confluentis]|uniref:Uncharacterized protein n=1 Tax=Mycolicibacterium confluentis TaxID=28047 RepID=A0A7I7Y050_9MYCO|nr:hypothetical protein [Mycolicibacterium confluentis]MCV7320007.1 hypothetical protein [Mycolicibacterium confluentis]ORV34559.1 hypothetical protein AWB99_02830 [Mycolicibacterium confluentis]BBZ35040.1 hypothetical protein MCNF_36450 [Mycolicibacterium confluentis]